MKYWMNAVGYGLPTTVRMMQSKTVKGSPLFSKWYGRNCKNTSFLKQLKMLVQNGK